MAVPVTTLEFGPHSGARTVQHAVYLKRTWGEAWIPVTWLFCESATWHCAPSIPIAQLEWDVGTMIRQGRLQPAGYAPLDVGRYFVKIEFECHAATASGNQALSVDRNPHASQRLRWHGTLEVSQETLEGIATTGQKTGRQKLICYGLAQMLARTPLDGHWWSEAGGAAHFSQHPATFNQRDAQGRLAANRSSSTNLMFSNRVQVDDLPWSSRSIVQYLLQHHPPRLTADPESFVFLQQIAAGLEIYIPDWDRPVVGTQDKSVWQLLCEILHRGRLLTFALEVNADDATLDLVPISLADDAIFTGEGFLLANPRQFHLLHHRDSACLAALRENTLQAIDQFVLQGARRSSIVSLGYQDAPGTVNATLERGWTTAQEFAYEVAASGGAGYGAAGTAEKQRRNQQARAREEVFGVYRRFQIPDAWSLVGKVKDGRGGTGPVDAFPLDFLSPAATVVNPRELRILPALPLKDGYDYSLTSAQAGEPATLPSRVSLGPHENLRPLVFFKIPDQTSRWIEASQIGKLGKEEVEKRQNHKMSVRVEIPQRDKAILLEVSGQGQHAIAYIDFTKLAVDPYCGQWEWRTAVFTVALEDDRFCEGKYPADATLMGRDTELRRMVVHVGDDYRTDWIAPHTALGVNPDDGTLVECATGGYCQDDRQKLQAKARLAWSYYSQGRNSLALSSDRPTSALVLGDLIRSTSGGVDIVGSIITSYTITIPPEQESVRWEIETGHAELDFLEHILERNRLY